MPFLIEAVRRVLAWHLLDMPWVFLVGRHPVVRGVGLLFVQPHTNNTQLLQTNLTTLQPHDMDDKQYQQCEVCKCAHGELHVFDSEQTIRYYITGRVQEAKKSNPAGGYAEFELPLDSKNGYAVLA
jgi:hypothetical protein